MESLVVKLPAAMAVSVHPTMVSSRRMKLRNQMGFSLNTHSVCITSPFRSRCATGVAGSDNCMALPVKEDFVDEEDYVKAGGSDILFVQMQRKKPMDYQSKLAEKLKRIPISDGILDLVVIGCGPAGLALAAESAKLGLRVGLVGPDLPFTNNYGVWADEFKDLGLECCIEHVWRDAIVYLDGDDPISIGRAYGRVSRHLLHEELLRRGLLLQFLFSMVKGISFALFDLWLLGGSIYAAAGDSSAYCWDVIVTGSEDGTARIWDCKSGKCIQIIDPEKDKKFKAPFTCVGCIALDSNESWLVCGKGQSLSLWNLPARECVSTVRKSAAVQDVVFDEHQILAVGAESVLTRFNMNGDILSQIQCAPQSAFSISLHPSGVTSIAGYGGLVDIVSQFGSHLCTVARELGMNLGIEAVHHAPDLNLLIW